MYVTWLIATNRNNIGSVSTRDGVGEGMYYILVDSKGVLKIRWDRITKLCILISGVP